MDPATVSRVAEKMHPEKERQVAKVLSAYYDHQSRIVANTLGYPMNAMFGNWVPEELRNITFIHVGDPSTSTDLYTAPHVLPLEHEVLQWAMKLWDAPNSSDYWGYVTSGSSESIMQAIYSAREALPGASLFFSAAAHYAVPKAGYLLGIQDVVPIDADEHGELDLAAFAASLEERSGRRVIVVLTCGTTLQEGHDNIAGALAVMDEAGVPDSYRYVHIDAALSGMVVAFDENASPDIRPSFRHGVDSISMSGHKLIGTCMPCGIFIAHRRYRSGTVRSAEIVSNEDPTVACSRNGQAVLEIWVRLFGYGTEGYRADVRRCLELASDVFARLQEHDVPATRNASAITVCFPKPTESIIFEFRLACVGSLAHVVIMPSVTKELVERFINRYVVWWSSRQTGVRK